MYLRRIDVYVNWGLIYLKLKKYVKVIEDYISVLKINFNLFYIYFFCSEGYIRLGELKVGFDDLYKVVEIY